MKITDFGIPVVNAVKKIEQDCMLCEKTYLSATIQEYCNECIANMRQISKNIN